ncbi:SH3 domain-containing protein [Lewinella sp. W8]|uniref:SH3 domain-containing protein n=1 Tax=Lewinella sp. W8 TaxID=2528208 RepID=UPI001067A745|nr:SH3 domain-containing protein [Lewinella sp. W8]MTB52104.1 SH3 domain-containing protein [Lewinella sp. W8]
MLRIVSLMILLGLLTACGSSAGTEATPAITGDSIPAEQSTPATDPAPSQVISWVENLNVRKTPDLKGEVVAQAKENDVLTLTGNKTSTTETIELRGKSYTEPWVEVTTADGKTGWVFGGAVKMPGERKGNALNTATKFTYPCFGTFDLTQWQRSSTSTGDDESDVSSAGATYQKGGQSLEIVELESEYYWEKKYTLKDTGGKVLKERTIGILFDVMPDEQKMLTEKVTDYTTSPATVCTRSEPWTSTEYFYNIKPRPDMVRGAMTTRQDATVGKGMTLADKPTTGKLSKMDGFCGSLTGADFSCSCAYNVGDTYQGDPYFSSDMDKNACVSINGSMQQLTKESSSALTSLKRLANTATKDWMVMKESGQVLYFGKPLEDYRYTDGVAFLVDVLLASDKKVTEIPVRNDGYQGMAIREVRDIPADAIQMVKNIRQQGQTNTVEIQEYSTADYRIVTRIHKSKDNGTEASEYGGRLVLLTHDGKTVLDEKEVRGTCGC